MKFIIVNPQQLAVETLDFDSLDAAKKYAGLENVDHGSLGNGVGYVVYEFGMFVPSDRQRYFSVNGNLVGGNAVFYAYDVAGETVDIEAKQMPTVVFYADVAGIEHAIRRGIVQRPGIVLNGETLWAWPDPAPTWAQQRELI